MRTRILVGLGPLCVALLLCGWQSHASQAGIVVAWGRHVLRAVSPGTRFTAVAAGSVLTAREKRFVTQRIMCSPGLVLSASQDEGQEP
jgi:hypothetical protein